MLLALRPTLEHWAARSTGEARPTPLSTDDEQALRELGYIE
jgi:hypothetical protein